MSLNESFHEHGRHDVLLGMTGRVKQVVTQSWQGQQPDAAPVNRGTLHGDGLIDKEQLTNQMSDAAPVNRGTLGDGSIDKEQATNSLSKDKKSELGMSKTIMSEVGTEGRPIQANVGGQAVGTQSAAGSKQQTSRPAQHVQTTDQILTAFFKLKLKGTELRMGLMETLEHCTLSDLQELAAAARVNPNLEKSELAGNICAVYCSTQGDSDVKGEEGNPVCSNNEHSELGMSQTNTNEDGKEGRPIQCALEDLQTLAAEAKLNPNLEKSALVRSIPRTYCMGSDGESGEANYVDPENELLYGRDEKGEASYGRTHDSRRSDLDDDYSALSANAGGQSKGAGPKVLLPSLCSPKQQLRCMALGGMMSKYYTPRLISWGMGSCCMGSLAAPLNLYYKLISCNSNLVVKRIVCTLFHS